MKKFLLSFLFVAGFGAYALYSHQSNADASSASALTAAPISDTPIAASPTITDAPAATPTPVTTPKPSPIFTPTPAPKPKGQYTDGGYTGVVADAYYGNIQVRATISGGRLTNVTFLQYPNDRSTSREINQQAMPLLKQEAIQAQSANVNGVSGASDSSAAFVESLSSALSKAKA